MGVYEKMQRDWQTYCLMSAIAYIEEMSKPTKHPQIKRYKDKEYHCTGYHSIRLKMKDKEFPKKLMKITRKWEQEKNVNFIGKSFKDIRQENYDGQYKFELSPTWINSLLTECGKIPNKYSFESAIERINNFVQYKKIPIDKNKFLFASLLENRELAAGVFLVSMDLECRGIQSGRISLCMSEKFKDFLEFMLKVAKKWNWATNNELYPVKVDYSRNLGINASPQYELRISIGGLKEIYELAGPLCDPDKDKCIRFHINRSKNYKNMGYNLIKNNTKQKIIRALKKGKNTTTLIQFEAGVGVDVIGEHLNKLEKEGKVKKVRAGKRYNWSLIKCQ